MSDKTAQTGIVLGSDSDLEVMQSCLETLQQLEISYEITVASAHRTPERTAEYAASAAQRGIKVIIAAAGWAAHLPGALAAYSTLPVLGVPISSSPIGGIDALYSIVQMPPGVPVASVGIDMARNAALLAAQILALGDPELGKRLSKYKQQMRQATEQKAARIESKSFYPDSQDTPA